MSLIGPRPLLVQYLPLYSEKQKHRHDVRPGLSGYAQVNGRNSISWTHKFELDCEYVEKITFLGTTVFHSYKLARKKFNEPINYVTSFYLIYFLMFGIVENAAINIEPLFMLFLLITAQLNYSRDFDFKDLHNNTCFRKGYKI